ncbi:MAG TPA: LL-diaminopimelate aminotransferase [Phycisphaerae bacterium]
MKRWRAARLDALPPYLFVEIDRRKRAALAAGKDVINLGIGDPDLPTPRFIVDRMAEAIRDPANHQYPSGTGSADFRRAVASFCSRRFGITLDPDREVLAVIGTKEGLGHLPLACVNPGETVLVPQPGYPVYESATIFAGAVPFHLPLTEEHGWLPQLEAIPLEVRRAARLMFLNYPNNPTGATATRRFFEEAIAFARRHDILIAHDAAYAEMYLPATGGARGATDPRAPSILEVPGGREVAVELHSLSKTFNMTGWRLGFAIGNADALAALAGIKSNMDSGQFNAIQQAGITALEHSEHPDVRACLEVYAERRDIVVAGLQEMGITVRAPQATFYVWARCPAGYQSMEFAGKVLEQAAVVIIPGVGFGAAGEGYFRVALTVPAERIREALQRLRRIAF